LSEATPVEQKYPSKERGGAQQWMKLREVNP
jgi:hypothetical protein